MLLRRGSVQNGSFGSSVRNVTMEQEIAELKKTIAILQERLYNAKENLTLYSCKKCQNLSMKGWTCPECGHDDTL